jgi:hypothetical protein
MIGISPKAEAMQREWEATDRAAWVEASDKLQADGWTLKKGNSRLPYFTKAGQPAQVLVRQLGSLNWQPRPETNPYF